MRWWFGSVLLLATACGGGLERVTFVTDRLDYHTADLVMLKLVNVGSAPVRVRLCAAVLEAQRGTVTSEGIDQPPCPEGLTELAPGAQLEARRRFRLFTTTGGAIPLRYRATLTLISDEQEDVFTPVFFADPNFQD